MTIVEIRLHRLVQRLDPPFRAAWDPVPRERIPLGLVELVTDDGRIGVGGGDLLLGADAVAARLLGADETRIEEHVRTLESADFHGGRPWPIEVALWDLLGQRAGLPMATLFGGALDRVPVYASSGELVDADERLRRCAVLDDRGIRAVKLRVDPRRADEGLEVVEAVRRALPRLAVMVDLNQGWRMTGDTRPSVTLAEAATIVRRLADLDVTWVEEPLWNGDPASLAALRRLGLVPVAGGEMVRTFAELVGLLDADAFDVFQADVVLSAGPSRCAAFARLARARGRHFTPHTWTDGLGLLANLHVTAGVGGGPFLELPEDAPGWSAERRDVLLAGSPAVVDGCLVVPDAPGLGIALDRDAIDDLSVGVDELAL